MVPNAWLTRKWCFFGHLNFIITFSMHKLKVCTSHSSLWDVVEVLAIRIAIPWIIGLNQAHAFTKRFIKSSWNMEVTVLQNWGKRWIESHLLFIRCVCSPFLPLVGDTLLRQFSIFLIQIKAVFQQKLKLLVCFCVFCVQFVLLEYGNAGFCIFVEIRDVTWIYFLWC